MSHDSGLPLCTIYLSNPPNFILATLLLLRTISHTPVCIICYLYLECRDFLSSCLAASGLRVDCTLHMPRPSVASTLGGLSEMGLRHERPPFAGPLLIVDVQLLAATLP
jgi:hypothetical protein